MVSLQEFLGQTVHFIGIGGCSMSGLAVILKNLGYKPKGSDINESAFTNKHVNWVCRCWNVQNFWGRSAGSLKR
jgi:UDP-N-acetylmuramate-alanine ligase